MIVHLEGRLVQAAPLSAVIDVHGIGYEVHIPVTTAERLPHTGESVRLHTHAVYREDSQALYAFISREERDFFRLLTEKVSGIGPKIALAIMSHLSLPLLQSAIAQGDVALLAKSPGIGKKTAERICIELRDKVAGIAASDVPVAASGSGTAPPDAGRVADAVRALIALGFKPDVADKAVRRADQKLGPDATVETLVKESLR